MARNEEKAQQMLNKWVTMKAEFNAGNIAERRPFLSSDCDSLADCEKWRLTIVKEITKKVAEVQNAGIGEHKLRDLNDQINKLLREKGHWQSRISELGGPNYNAMEPKSYDAEGRALPGGGGYKYFGAARDLPGVKELFDAPAPVKRKRTRGEMFKHVTPDYYGFRDDEGGELSRCETAAEAERRAEALAAEDAARSKRRGERRSAAPEDYVESSDDDPDDEPALHAELERAHAASTAQLETFLKAAPRAKPVPAASLDDKKRSLLQLFVDDALADDDDDLDLGPADAP